MKRLSHVTLALLAICIAWGGALRLWDLGGQSMWIDEGYTVNAGLSVLERGYPRLDSGALYTNGPLSVYASALAMKVFSFDAFSPWPARLPSALAGTALVAVGFFLARRLFMSDRAAVATAFVLAFFEWGVAWSRQARGYALVALCVCAALLLLERYMERRRPWELVASAALLVAALLSHGVAIVFFPAFLLYLVYRLKAGESAFAGVCLTLAGVIAASLAAIVLPLETSSFKAVYLEHAPIYAVALASVAAASLALGMLDRERRGRIAGLGLLAFVPLASVALLSPVVQFRYLFPAVPLLALLAGYGASRAGDFAGSRPALRLAASVAALALLAPFLAFQPKTSYALERGSPQPDFKSAFQAILAERSPGDVVISPYAQMHKAYLGEKGMWLEMSLAMREGEVARKSATGLDYYVGAPIVRGVEGLRAVLEGRAGGGEAHGFVIVDTLARGRLKAEAQFLESDPRFEPVFESGSSADSSRMTVYRF